MKRRTAKCLSRLALFSLLIGSFSAPFASYADEKVLLDGKTAARLLLDNRQDAQVKRKPVMKSLQGDFRKDLTCGITAMSLR